MLLSCLRNGVKMYLILFIVVLASLCFSDQCRNFNILPTYNANIAKYARLTVVSSHSKIQWITNQNVQNVKTTNILIIYYEIISHIKMKESYILNNAITMCLFYSLKPQLITEFGYNGETHFITTEDGYIVQTHRISGGPNSPPAKGKKVCLFMHALMLSSSTFVISGPDHSLGLIILNFSFFWNVALNKMTPKLLNSFPSRGWGIWCVVRKCSWYHIFNKSHHLRSVWLTKWSKTVLEIFIARNRLLRRSSAHWLHSKLHRPSEIELLRTFAGIECVLYYGVRTPRISIENRNDACCRTGGIFGECNEPTSAYSISNGQIINCKW